MTTECLSVLSPDSVAEASTSLKLRPTGLSSIAGFTLALIVVVNSNVSTNSVVLPSALSPLLRCLSLQSSHARRQFEVHWRQLAQAETLKLQERSDDLLQANHPGYGVRIVLSRCFDTADFVLTRFPESVDQGEVSLAEPLPVRTGIDTERKRAVRHRQREAGPAPTLLFSVIVNVKWYPMLMRS